MTAPNRKGRGYASPRRTSREFGRSRSTSYPLPSSRHSSGTRLTRTPPARGARPDWRPDMLSSILLPAVDRKPRRAEGRCDGHWAEGRKQAEARTLAARIAYGRAARALLASAPILRGFAGRLPLYPRPCRAQADRRSRRQRRHAFLRRSVTSRVSPQPPFRLSPCVLRLRLLRAGT